MVKGVDLMNKVLCAGELLIDFICTDKGISLQKGENFIKKCGGAPFNVAIAIQKLGANAIICGSVGNDPFGEALIEELNKYNVSIDNVRKIEKNTTLAFVSLQEDGERDFNFMRGADENYFFDDINKKDLLESNIFHFGSATAFLGGVLSDTYKELLEYAYNNNKVIIFDPNYRELLFGNKKELFIKKSIEYISKATLVKVSLEEGELITGKKELSDIGEEIINMGAKYVVITLGSKGTVLFAKGIEKHIKTKPVKMIDATGAGDAFIGAVIASIANNINFTVDDLIEYIKLGNKVGGIVVSRYGAIDAIPLISEL